MTKRGGKSFNHLTKLQVSAILELLKKILKIQKNLIANFKKKITIISKHRKQLKVPLQLIESAIEFYKDGNILKTNSKRINDAKRIAKTLEITQRSERIAWGIGDQFETLTELQILNRNSLLQKCLDNEIDNAAQAAILFDLAGIPMPKSIEMILKKTPIDKPEPVVDDVFSEEELDAEYEASMKEIEQQRKKWLPERVRGIEQIKHERKDGDTFSPGFEIRDKKNNE